jgi:hypothetical protein
MNEILGLHTKAMRPVPSPLTPRHALLHLTRPQRVLDLLFRKATALSLECEICGLQPAAPDVLSCPPPAPVVADVRSNARRSACALAC